MNFTLSSESQEKLKKIQQKFHGLGKRQSDSGKYFPLLISGKSGSGKDTILKEVINLLQGFMGIKIIPTHARYLTRKQRPNEVNTVINFIDESTFKNKTFGFQYEFGGNFYGLDDIKVENELSESNIGIVNGSPGSLKSMIDYLLKRNRLACVIYLSLDLENNMRLLNKRIGNELENNVRIGIISQETIGEYSLNELGTPIHTIQRNPSTNLELNQENFNDNVLECVQIFCCHIEEKLLS